MRKIAADLIANEMFSILKKNASWEEKADDVKTMMSGHADDDSADDDSADDDSADDDSADDAEDNLADYLMSNDEDDAEDDASYVDDKIKDMKSMSNDEEDSLMRRFNGSAEMNSASDMVASASDRHLMEGLGKIEASLRRKGEGFAADLVRTTALSIQEDIVKEASQKTFVLKNLVKMASDLDRKGEKKAADMVKSTIVKINR